jgi:hypothetical protein
MGAPIIPGWYSSPVLDLFKHVFDPIVLFVELLVVLDHLFSFTSRRNARGNPAFYQYVSEPVRIKSPISQKLFGIRQCFEHVACPSLITDLTFSRQQYERHAIISLFQNRNNLRVAKA